MEESTTTATVEALVEPTAGAGDNGTTFVWPPGKRYVHLQLCIAVHVFTVSNNRSYKNL